MRKDTAAFAEFVQKSLQGLQYRDIYFPKLV